MRLVWIAAGCTSLALGMIGAALPVLPTTPFIILAAFCFARGSQRLNAWLLNHPRFGPVIVAWQTHGAIPRKGKRAAIIGMAFALLLSVAMGLSGMLLAIQMLAMAGAATFILTRPEPPTEPPTGPKD